MRLLPAEPAARASRVIARAPMNGETWVIQGRLSDLLWTVEWLEQQNRIPLPQVDAVE